MRQRGGQGGTRRALQQPDLPGCTEPAHCKHKGANGVPELLACPAVMGKQAILALWARVPAPKRAWMRRCSFQVVRPWRTIMICFSATSARPSVSDPAPCARPSQAGGQPALGRADARASRSCSTDAVQGACAGRARTAVSMSTLPVLNGERGASSITCLMRSTSAGPAPARAFCPPSARQRTDAERTGGQCGSAPPCRPRQSLARGWYAASAVAGGARLQPGCCSL
jgi:hypothetical protein